ncbi:ethylene-responsive transcription factor ERF073-like [Lolium perenne]|uniref:ethylene-responsive transcription factor ERF073-like n=1 Tax=Lolium perenne TaxID=4522 RepID=UPI003A99ED41
MPPRIVGLPRRPNGTFYPEIRAGGFRVSLSTFNMPELAARVYDAAAWRFRRPRRDLNFQDVESLEEAEFLGAAYVRQAPRRAIAEFELDNPNTTWGDNDPRRDDMWTETTSDDGNE